MSIENRRRIASEAWDLKDELVLICAGNPISVPGGADQCFPYRPHPQYRWLTNRKREGGVLAFDPREGWTLFEPPVSVHEMVWGGGDPPVGHPIEELKEWLGKRDGRKIAGIGCEDSTFQSDLDLSKSLSDILDHARRPKDGLEVELLHRAAAATAAGFKAAKEFIQPGRTEREILVELEYGMAKGGAECTNSISIVATGPNTAVFHFVPGHRVAGENELVLIDSGAIVDAYYSDVTRTYPASGSFTEEQQWMYDSVLQALDRSWRACTVGAEWLDVHLVAAHSLAESLHDRGLMPCSPEEAVESGAISCFLPHGIGHMVGLGVRDSSGPLPGRKGDRKVAGVSVRMDLPLEAGYCVTVEPGLYFVPPILLDPKNREKYAQQIDWHAVDPWIGQGGVRLEDDILVANEGPINLTEAIPK